MTTLVSIDLNCDMGEFESVRDAELDLAIMPHISRCNIAVGGHAGNSSTIKFCFEHAAKRNLHIGLHPSYSDKDNFGRAVLDQPWDKTATGLIRQIELGFTLAESCAVKLSHIKLHGALYNQVEIDHELADNVADVLQHYDLAVLGMAHGQLQTACSERGISFIREAFIDRRYANLSQLQPRQEYGAVFSQQQDTVHQAVAIATHKPIKSVAGEELIISADSLCIHSDTPNAMQFLLAVKKQFLTHGIVTK